jgi:hypothetical protein
MSGAKLFKSAVPERSGPTDWRDGLERSGAKGRGWGGAAWQLLNYELLCMSKLDDGRGVRIDSMKLRKDMAKLKLGLTFDDCVSDA